MAATRVGIQLPAMRWCLGGDARPARSDRNQARAGARPLPGVALHNRRPARSGRHRGRTRGVRRQPWRQRGGTLRQRRHHRRHPTDPRHRRRQRWQCAFRFRCRGRWHRVHRAHAGGWRRALPQRPDSAGTQRVSGSPPACRADGGERQQRAWPEQWQQRRRTLCLERQRDRAAGRDCQRQRIRPLAKRGAQPLGGRRRVPVLRRQCDRQHRRGTLAQQRQRRRHRPGGRPDTRHRRYRTAPPHRGRQWRVRWRAVHCGRQRLGRHVAPQRRQPGRHLALGVEASSDPGRGLW